MSDGRTRPWCIPGWELECGLGIYLLCSCYYTTTAGAASAPAATISTTPWENGRWVCEPWFRWTCWIVFWQCDFYLFFCYFWTIPPLLPRDIKRFAANFKFHNQNIWRVFVFEGADEAFLDTNIYNIIQYIPNRTPHFKHLFKVWWTHWSLHKVNNRSFQIKWMASLPWRAFHIPSLWNISQYRSSSRL